MKMSAGNKLFLGLVIIQLLGAALVLGGFLFSVQADLHRLTEQQAEEVVLRSIEATEAHFRPAERVVEATRRLIGDGVIDRDRPEDLERYLFELLRLLQEIDGAYVGYADGGFHHVMRDSEVVQGGTRSKTIRTSAQARTVELNWRDSDFEVVEAGQDPDDTYDPRVRDWYRLALETGKTVWSDPYVFFTSRKPGITLASLVEGSGPTQTSVVGLDFDLEAISTFLNRQMLALGGHAYLVTKNGEVIANSEFDLVAPRGGGESDPLRFRKITELSGPEGEIGREAHERFLSSTGTQAALAFESQSEGQDYFVAVGHSSALAWPWHVIVVAPKAGVTDIAQGSNLVLIGIVLLATVLVSACGFAICRGIGRPLQTLKQNAALARNRNIEIMVDVDTSYSEISETDEVLRDLAKAGR